MVIDHLPLFTSSQGSLYLPHLQPNLVMSNDRPNDLPIAGASNETERHVQRESNTERILCFCLFALALVIACWLRFSQLDLRPFHHDEGVNSYFLLRLADFGDYKYDPSNYHGPSLYYFALLALKLLGKTDFALRCTPALFGVLTIALLWLLRRQIGTIGLTAAAAAIALSPGLVFFSRYFIHEMSFGLFTLGIVVGAWRYAESKNFSWLALLAASVALLATTKETAVVNLAVLLLALICAATWDNVRELWRTKNLTPAALLKTSWADIRRVLPSLDHALAAIIILAFIYIFLYSSLFTHWQGVKDFFVSIAHWTKERSGNDHVHPFYYYLGILLKLELPLLVGSLLAGLFVIWRGTRFWLFIAAWTLGITLAYSLIPYKTPWLVVSFLVPMGLLCGYAVEQLYRTLPLLSLRLLWLAVVAVAVITFGRLAWQVNFDHYDDNSNSVGYFFDFGRERMWKPYVDGQYGYVYAHTDRGLFGLVEQIKTEAGKLPSGNHTGVYIASPDYWPLPWYLRDFDQVAYSGNLAILPGESLKIGQPLMVANVTQQSQIDGLPGWRLSGKTYALRPGVDLILFARDETQTGLPGLDANAASAAQSQQTQTKKTPPGKDSR